MTITENEQIEEMTKIIGKPCYTIMNEAGIEGKECTLPYECHECRARRLYSKGYRKVERGEWSIYGMFDDLVKCTVCGDMHPMYTGRCFHFCPNCGADMRGEGK